MPQQQQHQGYGQQQGYQGPDVPGPLRPGQGQGQYGAAGSQRGSTLANLKTAAAGIHVSLDFSKLVPGPSPHTPSPTPSQSPFRLLPESVLPESILPEPVLPEPILPKPPPPKLPLPPFPSPLFPPPKPSHPNPQTKPPPHPGRRRNPPRHAQRDRRPPLRPRLTHHTRQKRGRHQRRLSGDTDGLLRAPARVLTDRKSVV